jgi:hypothetical protein
VGVGRSVGVLSERTEIRATGFFVNIAGRREKTDKHGVSLTVSCCFEKLI